MPIDASALRPHRSPPGAHQVVVTRSGEYVSLGYVRAITPNVGDGAPMVELQSSLAAIACFGAMSILTWRYILTAILALYLLQSYVYLGNHYAWSFINLTAKNLLRPLENYSIQIGKFDLRPVVAIGVILGFWAGVHWGAAEVYQRLPF